MEITNNFYFLGILLSRGSWIQRLYTSSGGDKNLKHHNHQIYPKKHY